MAIAHGWVSQPCLRHQFNRIWLATGTKFNVTEHPLLQDVLKTYPTEIVNGLPILDEHLRLPKSNFFIMGGLAALRIGPVAKIGRAHV